MPKELNKKKLTVYYDNQCLVCSRFIISVHSSKKEHVDCNALQNLNPKDMLSKQFHVIDIDGKVYRNFDAVLKIGEMYPVWKFLVTLARLPILYPLLSLGYKLFAKYRYAISQLLTRFTLLKIVLVIAMFSGLLLSPKLWLSSHLYPQIPVFSFLPQIPFPFDYFFFFLLLLVLGICLFKTFAQKYFFVFTLLGLGFILFDQSRLQPWFYQYLLMFAAFAFYSWKEKQTTIINTCCFIVASIYIYSGLQKLNPAFITTIFPWLIEPILQFFPKELYAGFLSMGTIVPYIETSIGIGLVTRRFRSLAVVAAISMHIFILYTLIWHNWNSVVWPWNIAMCCFVLVLFWKNQNIQWTSLFSFKTPVSLLIIVLCGIMPFLSFFNLWDAYLSASLYSGNTQTAQLEIQNTALLHLDPRLKQYSIPTDVSYSIIDVNDWSFTELNVPAYPETRIFKEIAKSLCMHILKPSDIILNINGKPDLHTGEITTRRYSCEQL